MPLASSPDEPMETRDGLVMQPIASSSSFTSGRTHKYEEVPSNKQMQRHFVGVRKQLADLPLPPKQMNVVSLVCMYTLMGLRDMDIAVALAMPIERIENIKMLDAYITVYNSVTEAIVNTEVEDVRTALVANSKKAAGELVSLLNDEFSAVRLSAAKDILDRTGHRPIDIVEHRHTMDGELRISITRDTDLSNIGAPLDAEGL